VALTANGGCREATKPFLRPGFAEHIVACVALEAIRGDVV
jgi:hypothetical protein